MQAMNLRTAHFISLHIFRDGRRAAALDTRFLRFYKVRTDARAPRLNITKGQLRE
jgi:hypothetical protein